MIYIGLDSYYDVGADILFWVEKIFYAYNTAMRNDMNDVVVALKVVHDLYREDERGERKIFDHMTKYLKDWCGTNLLFAVTGSCFVDFGEDTLVRIGINNYQCCCQEGIKSAPRAVLHVTHDVFG